MSTLTFYRVSELPSPLAPNSAYIVSGQPDTFQLVMTGSDISAPKTLSVDEIVGPEPEILADDILPTDTIQNAIYILRKQIEMAKVNPPGTILKKPPNMTGPCIVKTLPSVAVVKAGVLVESPVGPFVVGADIEISSLDAFEQGKDYDVYVSPNQEAFCILSGTIPPVGVAPNSVLIGGFHYSCIPYDTDLESGGFDTNPTGYGMIWSYPDLEKILGINSYSIWDLNFRPSCSPRGMTCVRAPNGRGSFWFDIYFTGILPATVGTSVHGVSIAVSGAAAQVPPMFAGKSSVYNPMNWYSATEIAISAGKHLMNYQEFCAAAFGVTENLSYGMTGPAPETTEFAPNFTSKWGGMQMSGVFWVWGGNTIVDPVSGWVEGERGDFQGTPRSVRFGGEYNLTVNSGSQCLDQTATTFESAPFTAMRFAATHIDSSAPYR